MLFVRPKLLLMLLALHNRMFSGSFINREHWRMQGGVLAFKVQMSANKELEMTSFVYLPDSSRIMDAQNCVIIESSDTNVYFTLFKFSLLMIRTSNFVCR